MSCIAILLVLQTVKLITKFRCWKDKSINFTRKDVEKTGDDNHENTPRTSNADGFFTENNVLSGKRCLHILFFAANELLHAIHEIP